MTTAVVSQCLATTPIVSVLRFLADDSGATAIEYAMIAGRVSIVILAAVLSIGTELKTTFTTVSTAFK